MKLYSINGNVYASTDERLTDYKIIQHMMNRTDSSVSTSHESVEILSPYVSLYDVEKALKELGLEQVSIITINKKGV
ncbi:hypothetical protein [Salmonella enterica]|uniref:hypothetical protein n=1 Tax=Salmonella enterica TaxID=28901 RepID=UPI003A806D6A